MNDDILTQVRKHRIIVAMRGVPSERMTAAAQAMYEGGIRMLEITFNQNDPQTADRTAAAIRAVNAAMGGCMLVGAGTVLTAAQARAAVEAGAKYLLSPNLDLEVMAEAHRLGTAMIPGAMTPSEVACAWKAGAALVKLFPADTLGLPYIKAMAAPLGHIPLLPMGGVNSRNLMEFLSHPSVAGVGVGSNIAKAPLIQAGDFDAIRGLAREFTAQLQ